LQIARRTLLGFLVLCQRPRKPNIIAPNPLWLRPIVLDQIDRNLCRQRLADAILGSLAGLDSAMQRDAQLRARVDCHLQR
jgi:hypothetical protein